MVIGVGDTGSVHEQPARTCGKKHGALHGHAFAGEDHDEQQYGVHCEERTDPWFLMEEMWHGVSCVLY